MKKTEFNELKGLEVKVLIKKMLQAKEELSGLILNKNMKQLKDKKQVYKKKRDIAQMMTVIRQKQLLLELESKKAKESKAVKTETKKSVKKKEIKI